MENTEKPTDEKHVKELMRACAAGDRKAYASLYSAFLPETLRYVYLFTKSWEQSEELTQELFVNIWEKRELLTAVTSFRNYLLKTAKNKVIDHQRHQQVQERYLESIAQEVYISEADLADNALIYDQYEAVARQAITLLPEKRREVFALRLENELSLDEISEKLSISKSVVKKQLYAANQFVREYLRKHADIVTDVVFISYILLP